MATGVICDKMISDGTKDMMYKMLVRPAMLYELKTVALTKKKRSRV